MIICAKKSGTETIKTRGTLDEQYKRLLIKSRGVYSAKSMVKFILDLFMNYKLLHVGEVINLYGELTAMFKELRWSISALE